jgi:hypothetical protein
MATMDLLICEGEADFVQAGEIVAGAAQRMPGRRKLDARPDVSLDGPEGAVHPRASCHQSLDDGNGLALCLIQADSCVLVFATLAPAAPSSDAISEDRASPTCQDIRLAATLAAMGAVHVAKWR